MEAPETREPTAAPRLFSSPAAGYAAFAIGMAALTLAIVNDYGITAAAFAGSLAVGTIGAVASCAYLVCFRRELKGHARANTMVEGKRHRREIRITVGAVLAASIGLAADFMTFLMAMPLAP